MGFAGSMRVLKALPLEYKVQGYPPASPVIRN